MKYEKFSIYYKYSWSYFLKDFETKLKMMFGEIVEKAILT